MTTTPAPLTPEEIKEFRDDAMFPDSRANINAAHLTRCLDEIERLQEEVEVFKARQVPDGELFRFEEKVKLQWQEAFIKQRERADRLNSRLQRNNELIKKAEQMADHIAWKPLSHTEASYREALGEADKLARALLSDIKKHREDGK